MDVTAREAGVIGQDFGWGPVEGDEVLVPCFTSLPMGFSWSLYFCQAAAESQVNLAACPSHVCPMTARSPWFFVCARQERLKSIAVHTTSKWTTFASLQSLPLGPESCWIRS